MQFLTPLKVGVEEILKTVKLVKNLRCRKASIPPSSTLARVEVCFPERINHSTIGWVGWVGPGITLDKGSVLKTGLGQLMKT